MVEVEDVFGYIVILAVGAFFFLIMIAIISSDKYEDARDQSCSKIGMEYYETQGSDFCIDQNNKAHNVKIDCEGKGFLSIEWDCTARIISLGEYRVT